VAKTYVFEECFFLVIGLIFAAEFPALFARFISINPTNFQLDRVLKQSNLSNSKKFQIYSSCVLSLLMYGSETWTMLKSDVIKL